MLFADELKIVHSTIDNSYYITRILHIPHQYKFSVQSCITSSIRPSWREAMPYSFLHVAALRNDVVKAQQLIDGEAKDDVHVWRNMPLEMRDKNFDPIFVDERDASGWTPLMIAATPGHMAMCKLLVEREADIHAKKNFKCSALHLAARNGHKGIVSFLLQCNADVLAKILKSTSYSDYFI